MHTYSNIRATHKHALHTHTHRVDELSGKKCERRKILAKKYEKVIK